MDQTHTSMLGGVLKPCDVVCVPYLVSAVQRDQVGLLSGLHSRGEGRVVFNGLRGRDLVDLIRLTVPSTVAVCLCDVKLFLASVVS